jgi:hydroxyethylthiazole kinase-like uncharacterized protein yjeF
VVHHIITHSPVPVIIDADGLTALTGKLDVLSGKQSTIVLTPHPGEMARLCGVTPADVQADRMAIARRFAMDNDVIVVLKGAGTLIAGPDGEVILNPTGNPGMATGGMGDILTGMIAGLIAQGVPPTAAAAAGVYLHGAAADRLADTMGPSGYLATDILGVIPGRKAALLAEVAEGRRCR